MQSQETTLYDKNVEKIIERYNELVEQTQKALFPWWEFNTIEAPNFEGMRKSQKVVTKIVAPHPFPGKLFSTFYFGWIIIFTLWMAIIMAYFDPSTTTGKNVNPPGLLVTIVTVVLFIIPPILMYYYTLWFLFTRRVSWKTRVSWFVSLVIVSNYLYQLFQPITTDEFITITNPPVFNFLLPLIFIPTVLFLVFNLLYYGKFLIELIVNLLSYFISAHEPIAFRVLRQIIVAPVESKKGSWYLSKSEQEDIHTLKELAHNNEAATEKKTIPVVILLGVIAFLATLSRFQEFFGVAIGEVLNRILEALIVSKNASNMTFGRILFDYGILFIVGYIIKTYVFLFRNLLVQGIIVQACTIAEHAQRQALQITSQDKKKEPIISRTLKQCVAFLHSILIGNRH